MYSIASWEVKCHVGTFLAGFLLDTAFGLSGMCIKSDTLTLLLGALCSIINLSIHARHGNRDGNQDTHKETKHHFKILYLLPGEYIIIFFCWKLHLSTLKQKKNRIEWNSPKQLKCPTMNLLLLPPPSCLHQRHVFGVGASVLLPHQPRHCQTAYLEEKVALVESETQTRQHQINQQVIHLDLPVSVGTISIVAVVVTMFSSANPAALAWCTAIAPSTASWCSFSTCSLKLGMSNAWNACLACSWVTSIRVSDTSSWLLSHSPLDWFLVGYFPRGGLFNTRFFCAKVGTTSFSFCFGFRLATIEFKNDYKWDNRSSRLSCLGKMELKTKENTPISSSVTSMFL